MFSSLEQRMAQSYLDMFPPFIPDSNSEVSIMDQEKFYLLMNNLYQLAKDQPLLFVPALHKDDAYPNRFHKSSYKKPELLTTMKKFLKSIDAFLETMFTLGQGKEVKLNKKQKTILSKLEVNDFTNLPIAWRWMANREGANINDFSHCFFKTDYSYASDIYSTLLGTNAFRKLEKWMFEYGYKEYCISDVTASDCKLNLTYANPAWSNEVPRGGFEYKIKHTGISVRYDTYITTPCVVGLCIPNGLKVYLEHFDNMEKQLQTFVLSHTKRCDGCNYCVQTDKTGTRPLARILVEHDNHRYYLCPYFPGCGFCWTNLDEELTDSLIGMLSFMDTFSNN